MPAAGLLSLPFSLAPASWPPNSPADEGLGNGGDGVVQVFLPSPQLGLCATGHVGAVKGGCGRGRGGDGGGRGAVLAAGLGGDVLDDGVG